MPVDQSGSDDAAAGTDRQRRAHVVAVVDEEQTPMTIDELTDYVLEWETDRFPSKTLERRQLREELHEVDLPALADQGLVEFNQDEGLVGRHEGPVHNPDHDTDPSSDQAAGVPWRRNTTDVLDAVSNRTAVAVAVGIVLGVSILTALVVEPVSVAVVVGGAIACIAIIAGVYRTLVRIQ